MNSPVDENGERFVRWALDDGRTIEERYTVELIVEELQKEHGIPVKPEDFAVPARVVAPPPEPEEEEEDADSDSDIAVKKNPDPTFFDPYEAHPLADKYLLAGNVFLSEVWFYKHLIQVANYLMRREPDVIIPDEPNK